MAFCGVTRIANSPNRRAIGYIILSVKGCEISISSKSVISPRSANFTRRDCNGSSPLESLRPMITKMTAPRTITPPTIANHNMTPPPAFVHLYFNGGNFIHYKITSHDHHAAKDQHGDTDHPGLWRHDDRGWLFCNE